jgi:hypothetical protein
VVVSSKGKKLEKTKENRTTQNNNKKTPQSVPNSNAIQFL